MRPGSPRRDTHFQRWRNLRGHFPCSRLRSVWRQSIITARFKSVAEIRSSKLQRSSVPRLTLALCLFKRAWSVTYRQTITLHVVSVAKFVRACVSFFQPVTPGPSFSSLEFSIAPVTKFPACQTIVYRSSADSQLYRTMTCAVHKRVTILIDDTFRSRMSQWNQLRM